MRSSAGRHRVPMNLTLDMKTVDQFRRVAFAQLWDEDL